MCTYFSMERAIELIGTNIDFEFKILILNFELNLR